MIHQNYYLGEPPNAYSVSLWSETCYVKEKVEVEVEVEACYVKVEVFL